MTPLCRFFHRKNILLIILILRFYYHKHVYPLWDSDTLTEGTPPAKQAIYLQALQKITRCFAPKQIAHARLTKY